MSLFIHSLTLSLSFFRSLFFILSLLCHYLCTSLYRLFLFCISVSLSLLRLSYFSFSLSSLSFILPNPLFHSFYSILLFQFFFLSFSGLFVIFIISKIIHSLRYHFEFFGLTLSLLLYPISLVFPNYTLFPTYH